MNFRYIDTHTYTYICSPPKDLGSHILIYNQVDGAHSLRLMGWVRGWGAFEFRVKDLGSIAFQITHRYIRQKELAVSY